MTRFKALALWLAMPIISLFVVFSLEGCAATEPGPYPNYWTQCIKTTMVGVGGLTAYGPWVIGYAVWERNVNCKVDIEAPNPFHSVPIPMP